MNEPVPPYSPNEPWVQRWIEHKQRFRAAEVIENFSKIEAEIDRIMQDEIELQIWLKQLSALSQSQKEKICQERSFD